MCVSVSVCVCVRVCVSVSVCVCAGVDTACIGLKGKNVACTCA